MLRTRWSGGAKWEIILLVAPSGVLGQLWPGHVAY